MRFAEFKLIFEQAQSTGYYTVGDSHAVGLANYAGKPWISKAKNGTRSDNSMHSQAINTIPKGSVVLISLGANDTFANVKPEVTASNVARLVGQSKNAGHKVAYLLFPIGTRPNAELRAQTRDSIKQAIDVPIIDLEGSNLVDGVHADAGSYIRASKEVLGTMKPSTSLGVPDTEPGAPTTKSRIAQSADLEQGPPYPIDKKNEIKQMQSSLEELGYSVGRTGVDGKYGPYTAAAVSAFKKDYNIQGNGSTFDQASVAMLSKINSGQVARVENPTKSNVSGIELDIPALTSVENVDNAKKTAEEFLGRRMNDDEWKHLIQTITAESTSNPKEMAQIAAVILNRTRVKYGGRSTVVDIVWAPGQFEPVTGNRKNPGPNANFLTPVNKQRLAQIITAIQTYLPDSDRDYLNFTSANPAAYSSPEGKKFLDKMIASGGNKIGGTIFGTVA